MDRGATLLIISLVVGNIPVIVFTNESSSLARTFVSVPFEMSFVNVCIMIARGGVVLFVGSFPRTSLR